MWPSAVAERRTHSQNVPISGEPPTCSSVTTVVVSIASAEKESTAIASPSAAVAGGGEVCFWWRVASNPIPRVPILAGAKSASQPSSMAADESAACQTMIDRALASSAAVRTLMKAMERAGCPVDRSFFSCERCSQECQGGYDRERGVILCQQHMQGSAQLIETTMVHELVHAFDDCRAHVNWTDLKHHACTEIRAANLSGDCSFSQEVARGNFNLRAQQQKCVRRRAELSVAMNPSSQGALAARLTRPEAHRDPRAAACAPPTPARIRVRGCPLAPTLSLARCSQARRM